MTLGVYAGFFEANAQERAMKNAKNNSAKEMQSMVRDNARSTQRSNEGGSSKTTEQHSSVLDRLSRMLR